MYVVKLLTHNGIYVLLDNQFNLDTTVLDNQSVWLSDWLTLLRAVAQDPISASMLMVDVLNVSHSRQLQGALETHPLLQDVSDDDIPCMIHRTLQQLAHLYCSLSYMHVLCAYCDP